MDQIKKRLEIIKIAIFISDYETIKLQLLKLEYFHENEELEKIINLLKHKNYGQAQVLISQYLNDSNDTNKKNSQNDSDLKQIDNKNSIIEEFGLLKSNNSSIKHTIQSSHQNTKQNKTKNSITSYVATYKDFKLSSDEIEKIPSKKQTIQKESPKEKVDFSDIFPLMANNTKQEKAKKRVEEIQYEKNGINNQISKNLTNDSKISKEIDYIIPDNETAQNDIKNEILKDASHGGNIQKDTIDDQAINKTMQSANKSETLEGNLKMSIDMDNKSIKAYDNNLSYEKDLQNRENNNQYYTKYPPLSDIFYRFQNIALFYIDDKDYTLHKSATSWMHRISNFGYKDIEILKISKHIQHLKENKQYDEARQLTIICGATESNLGKLIFARELYRGDIFTKDDIKACEMTKELALMDYPEALCDLGQYCEHGIGTKKNLEYALHFYKKASDLGLERAHILYKNLKQKKGLFSFLFKSEH